MEKTSRKTTRRYWRQTATPRSWWPWGIAPLAGLAVVFLIGALLMAPRIEAEVREQVAERIVNAGLPAMDVRSDGQGVTVNTRAEVEEELYLKALAASTRCNTWAGRLACPTSVEVWRIEPDSASALSKRRPHRFTAEKIDYGVRLTGEVPDLEEHDRILGVAGQHFSDITNGLSISNESAGANFGKAADQTIAIASQLASGKASWSGEALTVNGSADADAVDELSEQFGAIGDASLQGEFNVRPLVNSRQCNTNFDQVLSNAAIRFQTGSASIDAGNDALLVQLVEIAHGCRGRLTVEGHTDNRGDADKNRSLSLARAEAVRDALVARGIEADRITAAGFGESRPIASNGTSDGRAKNRRIAVTIEE